MNYASRDEVENFLGGFTGPRCWKCKHFDPAEQVTVKEILGADLKYYELSGECRVNPPVVNFQNEELDGVWPMVYGRDYCGSFVECNRNARDLTFDSSDYETEGE